VATVNVTETPTTLDTTGAAELAVTNTGGSPVYVNTQRLRPGQRGTFDTSRPLQVTTQPGQASTVDTAVAVASGTTTGSTYARATGYGSTGMVTVASNGSVHDQTPITNQGGIMSRTKFQFTADTSELRLPFGNFIINPAAAGNQNVPSEQPGANPITVRASLEYPAGKLRTSGGLTTWSGTVTYVKGDQVTNAAGSWVSLADANLNNAPPTTSGGLSTWWQQVQFYPIHFAGETATRDVTIQPGQVVVSEAVALLPAGVKGDTAYINVFVQPNNGTANTGSIPVGMNGAAGGGFDTIFTSATGAAPPDYTLTTPASLAAAAGSQFLHGPLTVLGKSRNPGNGWGLLGDSMFRGTGDGATILGDIVASWVVRALTDNPAAPTKFVTSHHRVARGGDQVSYYLGTGAQRRLAFASGWTHVLGDLGVNDLGNGAMTFAQVQANLLALWNALAARDCKVYWTTVTPYTSSTDAWATVGGQTARAGFGAGNTHWANINAWLLTVPAPLSGVLDVASVVTDPATGFWKAGATTDGLHPTQPNHIAIANLAKAQGWLA
jgi:hypothetical protein